MPEAVEVRIGVASPTQQKSVLVVREQNVHIDEVPVGHGRQPSAPGHVPVGGPATAMTCSAILVATASGAVLVVSMVSSG